MEAMINVRQEHMTAKIKTGLEEMKATEMESN
jgi:hypothetical protein